MTTPVGTSQPLSTPEPSGSAALSIGLSVLFTALVAAGVWAPDTAFNRAISLAAVAAAALVVVKIHRQANLRILATLCASGLGAVAAVWVATSSIGPFAHHDVLWAGSVTFDSTQAVDVDTGQVRQLDLPNPCPVDIFVNANKTDGTHLYGCSRDTAPDNALFAVLAGPQNEDRCRTVSRKDWADPGAWLESVGANRIDGALKQGGPLWLCIETDQHHRSLVAIQSADIREAATATVDLRRVTMTVKTWGDVVN